MADFVERMPLYNGFLSALCDLCGKKIVAEYGGLCRILSQYVADYGRLCRSMWRIVADFVVVCGGLWRNMASECPSIMASLSALCDLCGKKIYGNLAAADSVARPATLC